MKRTCVLFSIVVLFGMYNLYHFSFSDMSYKSQILLEEVEALSEGETPRDFVQKYLYKNWHEIFQIEDEDGEMLDTDSVIGRSGYRWCLTIEQVEFVQSQGYVYLSYHEHGPKICSENIPLR